jgi:hypothetical protein
MPENPPVSPFQKEEWKEFAGDPSGIHLI